MHYQHTIYHYSKKAWLVCLLLLCVLWGDSALGQINDIPVEERGDAFEGMTGTVAGGLAFYETMESAGHYSYCSLVNDREATQNIGSGKFILEDVVNCLRYAVDFWGWIYQIHLMKMLERVIILVGTLAIIILGIKVITGGETNYKRASVLLAFKLVLVFSFCLNDGGYEPGNPDTYDDAYPQARWFRDVTMTGLFNFYEVAYDIYAAEDEGEFGRIHPDPANREFTPATPPNGNSGNDCSGSIFARLDCLFFQALGLQEDEGVASIGVLVSGLVLSGPVGGWIATIAAGMIISFLVGMAQAAMIFIGSILVVSLLAVMMPIMMPMMLFAKTKQMFMTWTQYFLVYMIVPVLMVIYLTMMLMVLYRSTCETMDGCESKGFSVYQKIMDRMQTEGMFQNIYQFPQIEPRQDKNPVLLRSFEKMGEMGLARPIEETDMQAFYNPDGTMSVEASEDIRQRVESENETDPDIGGNFYLGNKNMLTHMTGAIRVPNVKLNPKADSAGGHEFGQLITNFSIQMLILFLMTAFLRMLPEKVHQIVAKGIVASMGDKTTVHLAGIGNVAKQGVAKLAGVGGK